MINGRSILIIFLVRKITSQNLEKLMLPLNSQALGALPKTIKMLHLRHETSYEFPNSETILVHSQRYYEIREKEDQQQKILTEY